MALTKVSTDGVKDDAITKTKIPANQIEASEIANGTITNAQIADSTIGNVQLAGDAVTTAKIADNAVTAGKLASGVQTTINSNADNRVITGSGTANTLNGESNVTIDSSSRLTINATAHGVVQTIKSGGSTYGGAISLINSQSSDYRWDIAVGGGDNAYVSGRGLLFRSITDSKNVAAFQTDGNVLIHDGNLKLASGHGIDFSATFDGSNVSGVTASSELLDDYEEGTFQPILKRLMTNNVTETNFYTQGTREGNYTRIGDRVWITGRIHWNGGSTGSGKLIMTNLPFTINTGGANEIPIVVGYRSGFNYANISAYGGQNMNRFYITYYDSNGTYHIAPSATASSGTFYFSAHYELV